MRSCSTLGSMYLACSTARAVGIVVVSRFSIVRTDDKFEAWEIHQELTVLQNPTYFDVFTVAGLSHEFVSGNVITMSSETVPSEMVGVQASNEQCVSSNRSTA
jgi:hypothetical protein